MKLKVKTGVMIAACDAYEAELRKQIADAEQEIQSGSWREKLADELRELATEIEDGELAPQEIGDSFYMLKNLSKADGAVGTLQSANGALRRVESARALLRASSTDGYMVDEGDPFWMKVVQAAKT